MLEQLVDRLSAETERRAAVRREAIASAVSIPGVRAHVEDDAVVLEGRGLARRVALDPVARWQLAEARHGE